MYMYYLIIDKNVYNWKYNKNKHHARIKKKLPGWVGNPWDI